MRLAAIGDLHCRASSGGCIQHLLPEFEKQADVLVICGDITDNGLPAEAELLAGELQDFPLPVFAVLGNHDHEGGQAETITRLLTDCGIRVLDGTAFELDGVGFVGTKGFCGGFDNLLIQPFGEAAIKSFINTGIEEAMRLENSLTKLDCQKKVAILHYSPIKDTLAGEAPELFPFLGCSRLANALDRHQVNVILHGHAHHGSPYGVTPAGIPVHNVCRFVQSAHTGRPYCIIEV